MARKYLEILCTPDVLAAQERHYGRARPVAAAAAEVDPLGTAERDFIAARDSFYLASIGQSGWPYVQHRGGATGFLRVLGPTTIAFADYTGNRQLITTGNVAGSDRVSLFLMDYAHRRRLKLLGHARIEDVRERPDLVAVVAEPSRARPGRKSRRRRARLVRLELPEVHHPPLQRGRGCRKGRASAA